MAADVPLVSYRKAGASSERAFGMTFAAVFTLISFWPLAHHHSPRWWALAVGLASLGAALLAPHTLRPLNRLWQGLGLILHRVVNPIVMGLVFFGAVVPTAIILRLLGKDLLKLKRDAEAETYWMLRTPPGPTQRSMSKQY